MNDINYLTYTPSLSDSTTPEITEMDFANDHNYGLVFPVNFNKEPEIENNNLVNDILPIHLKEPTKPQVTFDVNNTNDRQKLHNEMVRLGFNNDEIKYYDKLAGRESTWTNHKGVKAGGSYARGYFQFLDSTLKGLGYNKKANDMTISEQLIAIKNFTDKNKEALMPYLDLAKAKNISLSGMLAGAHLGGVRGAINYLKNKSNASDKFGTSVGNYMKQFS